VKITVVNAMAPFIWGGAEELALHLVLNLRAAGHDTELLRLPFNWDPYERVPVEIARMRALKLSGADRVVSLKFPTYLIEADNHRTWLIHQFRQAYDLWGTTYGNLPDTVEGRRVRDLVHAADDAALRNREGLFTTSDIVTDRLHRFNGIKAPTLPFPLNDPELFHGGDYDTYILASGRVNSVKRQWLLLEAMHHLGPNDRLIVAGPPETPGEADRLRKMVEESGLTDRVKLDLRFLDRHEVAKYVNNCRAVAYVPFDEDAYGYVTMEAFEAGKPVITCVDSGAVTQLVAHDRTGMVVEPDAEAVAGAMRQYLADEELARNHGAAARDSWRSRRITWSDTIHRLLGE
jgi:glycosyltransferase involved in cell wall biosynthesis